MVHIIGGILIGAFLAKTSSKQLRPLVRGAVKAGLRMNQKAQELGKSAKQEAENLVAEARAELQKEAEGGQV